MARKYKPWAAGPPACLMYSIVGAATVSLLSIRIFSAALSKIRQVRGAPAHDLEVVAIVAPIKRQVETPRAWITKQIGILIALIRYPIHQHFFFLKMNAVAG